VRRLHRIEPGAVTLFEDETTLRWFPPLRGMWAPRGEPAEVPITGQNAKRVLFGAINFRTGHRVVLRRSRMRQADFQEFLRLLRRRYGGRPRRLGWGSSWSGCRSNARSSTRWTTCGSP
jgi:hypothetical protein